MEALENFTGDLDSSLGIKRTEVSLSQIWNFKPPAAAGPNTIEEYLYEVGSPLALAHILIMLG